MGFGWGVIRPRNDSACIATADEEHNAPLAAGKGGVEAVAALPPVWGLGGDPKDVARRSSIPDQFLVEEDHELPAEERDFREWCARGRGGGGDRETGPGTICFPGDC